MKPCFLLILVFVALGAASRVPGERRQILGDPTETKTTPSTPTNPPSNTGTDTSTGTKTDSPSNTGTGTGTGTGPGTNTGPSQGLPTISGPSLPTNSGTSTGTNTSATPTQESTSDPANTFTSTTTVPNTSTTSDVPSPSQSNDDGGGDSSVSTGTIVGLSVAGGIAVIGAIAFIIWKLTRKRFSEFDADGEEIKWPELGHESHALPTRQTGRAGIDDDGYDEAGVGGAGRGVGNYAPSTTTGEQSSMADLHSYNDPYAVPPLPHLDPNQPYHDDPANYGGHYDPYQGPVPQSFHEPGADRYNARSPVPTNYGRQSPGPSLSYQRTGY